MTYPTKPRLLLVAALAVFVASCTKTPDNVSEPTNVGLYDKTKLNSLFATFRYTPQQFTVSAGTLQVVRGQKGTKLTFYPNTFKDAAGNSITSGTIDVRLTEMYTPGDMIANRATTMGKNEPLVSGGQVLITATHNGQPVTVNKYGIAYANASKNEVMNLFPGNTNNPDSVTTWGDPIVSVGTFCVTGTVDTSADTTLLAYKFDSCTTLNWVNCDRFMNDSAPKTKVYAKVNNALFNSSNTQTYLIFPTINSVTVMGDYEAVSKRFGLYSFYALPVGLPVNVVVMSAKDNKFYYFEKKGLTVTANMEVDASGLTEQTEQYIKDKLKQL
jgi:hypothetical protein